MKARFFAIAALVLGLASCQKDFAPEANLGAEVDYRLEVSAPELGTTRAGVDGADTNNAKDSAFGAIDYFQGADWSKVDLRYTLEIYDADENGELKGGVATLVKDRQAIVVDEYKAVTFETRLAPKRNYRFVVFADFVEDGAATAWSEAQKLTNDGLNHRIGATLANIELINEDINDEASDAYFAFKHVVPGNNTHNTDAITLTRPYGKLRVVATDLHELNLNVKPGSVKVVYNAYNANAFNAVEGTISGEYATNEFDYDYVKEGIVYTEGKDALKGEKDRNTHMTIFTDYILATDAQHTINFNMLVNDEDGVEIKATAFSTEIPVQRNHLTTIIGNVLTTATEIEVTINDNFANGVEDAPTYVEVWDGKSKNEPKYDAETDTYFVARASELAWIAAQVNTGNNFAGATVKVIAPIELNCEYWTPIGYGDDGANFYSFNGTFDGGDWTIANLCIRDEAADYCNGLFGMTENATIKNVKLNGVIVNTKGGDTAALVGAINGTTVIKNIAVEGLVQIDTDMASAGRVGTIVGGGWTSHNVALSNISVNVDEESYVKANTYVGGVAGQILGVTSMTNIYSNIDVYAYNGIVGGIIGSIQHNSTV
ncbi:MAG: hypothetical protein J6Q28_04165, partial [Alistipes sp.]|nr:hypothetical protein [Alistipes sp.]